MSYRPSGRNEEIRKAIREHGKPLACAIEKDALIPLIGGEDRKVRQSIRQLVHLDQIVVYLALNE